jgi:hypothetical protein
VEKNCLNNIYLIYMSKEYVVSLIVSELDPEPVKMYDWKGDYESLVLREEIEKPSKEVFDSRFEELYALEPMRRLREERDRRLCSCDWIFSLDVPSSITEEKKEEWKIYRQALRDITSNSEPTLSEDGSYLLNVTWPVPPS